MVLGEQDISGDVIAEIITAIIRKNLLLLYNDKQNGKLLTYLMRDALPYLFYEYILYLLDYFEVDIDRVFEMDFFNDEERNRFRSYVSDVIQVANSKRVNNERDIRLLNAIAKRVALLLNAQNGFDVKNSIPELEDLYLITLNDNNNKISFEGVDTKSIEQISYLLI